MNKKINFITISLFFTAHHIFSSQNNYNKTDIKTSKQPHSLIDKILPVQLTATNKQSIRVCKKSTTYYNKPKTSFLPPLAQETSKQAINNFQPCCDKLTMQGKALDQISAPTLQTTHKSRAWQNRE